MTVRIGINGFGRIGRTIFRAAQLSKNSDMEIVHINDLTDSKTIAHLLRYDSVHGKFPGTCQASESGIRVNDQEISLSALRSPAELPWAEKKVDIVFECTGIFRNREAVQQHLTAGAPKVLISAPAKDEDLTVVFGVNSSVLGPEHKIVSNGSCTTNCLAPVTKVLHDVFGIESGLMTTVHSYTNDQSILDLPHSDLRRARAAALNMIPTSTGAAKAIGMVLPDLNGKIDGLAVRVPTPNVSLVDVTFQLKRSTTAEKINAALEQAAEGDLKGILGFTMEPLVSSDFNGDSCSSYVDGSMTKVVNGHLAKVLAWYDNESGFSYRMLDVARLMCQHK
ncbi:MAG: type I glyceraldehyde-3-phosphate dehydrogenase [Deltaproteobacteria bacterium]|nr:type I glyceraldehyde-3-phosphate dehydrogenase [Deltaproteobacteria bacterium]